MTQLKQLPEPENEQESQPEGDQLDFSRPDFKFTPQGLHGWRQMGYYLICTTCQLQHAVWVGAERIMVGMDEQGRPVLKTRKELGMA